jgi:abortive infection bacteriophage resistance protein
MSRNLIIDDDEEAIFILQKVSYYRLSAYMLTYKTEDGLYEGASIKDIYDLYHI